MDNKRPPETFEEAVDHLCSLAPNPNTYEDPFYHMSVGMSLRNEFKLWDRDSPLHKHMLKRFGLCHADDTSMLISNAARAKLENKDYNPSNDIERCKKHWLGYGLDAKTMEKISEN